MGPAPLVKTELQHDTRLVVTDDQLSLIKRTIAVGATDDELQLHIYNCQRRNCHPLDGLIHFTKRGGRYVPVVGIDYLRSRAAITREYAGNDDAVFSGVTGSDKSAATVTVYRLVEGTRCAFTATARWTEYYPSGYTAMWDKMPHTMLGKCAEALALRKGFPEETSGLYLSEEMDQAGPVQSAPAPTPALPKVTPKRVAAPRKVAAKTAAPTTAAPSAPTPKAEPTVQPGTPLVSTAKLRRLNVMRKGRRTDAEFDAKLATNGYTANEIPEADYDELCAWARGRADVDTEVI